AYTMSFQVYIPDGKAGYFNALSEFTQPGTFEWGMECYFDVGGGGRVLGGSSTAIPFSYTYDTWHMVEVVVDLDHDLAELRFNGTSIHEWQWTLGASGDGSQLQLDANDFFGATANDEMYFDDYMIAITDSLIVGIEDNLPEIPKVFALSQNYPNPFNPTTTINFQLPKASDVRITIYNAMGQKVRTLVTGQMQAGSQHVVWDAKNDYGVQVSSGIYFYRMTAGKFTKSMKMLLLK
ncbi:MAG: T9SS type A sorting domain-containing protein, partial [Calditrichia bacterium]|nr:T9SS type A sorting domain-containing protein [Calditrichia bacterium]